MKYIKKSINASVAVPSELKVVLLIAIIAVCIMVGVYIMAPNTISAEFGGPTAFGQFGDYIGGILNPIFGFLTVCLLLYSNSASRKASELSEKEYDRKQIEYALELGYEKLKLMLCLPLSERVPYDGIKNCYTLEDAMKEVIASGRIHMHELNEKMVEGQLSVQLFNIFGDAQRLIIQVVALTIDLVAITHKDSLKEFRVRRANELLMQFTDYGTLDPKLAGKCLNEIQLSFDLSLRNSFINRMNG